MLFLGNKKYCNKQYGEYTIIKSIGEGRYGMCFLAHSAAGTPVIIKRFKPHIFKKNKTKNSYEAVILSQLQSDAIPEFLGVINEKGFYAYVLELKQGFTVKDILFKYKHNFTKEEFFNIGHKLIAIIKYIHKNGVVHRDIRIPNVLINNQEVYLIDFGLARWANNDKYSYELDFSYLGDFLLYLLYSAFERKEKYKSKAWYEELSLTNEQKLFLKKLLGLEEVYKNIENIETDFMNCFKVLI